MLVLGYKSLDDLKHPAVVIPKQGLPNHIRDKCNILFIDDNPKQIPIKLLISRGFSAAMHGNVTELTPHILRKFSHYDIIACDIQGVGRKIDSELEGAYLLYEIRRHFPQKVLISYTTAAKPNIVLFATFNSDFHFQRNDSESQIMRVLDESIVYSIDIRRQIRILLSQMIQKNEKIINIIKFEDYLVRQINKDNLDDINSFTEKVILDINKSNIIRNDLKDMVKSFIPNIFSRLLFG